MFFKKMVTTITVLTASSFIFSACSSNPMSSKPSDSQIVNIVSKVNEAEVSQAQLAQSKAMSPEVREYAQETMEDHQASNSKIMAFNQKYAMTPSGNIKSGTLAMTSEKDMAMLKNKDGADFDRAYMESEIKNHQAVLENLNEKLIPNAKNEELKDMLMTMKTDASDHLEHAQEIRSKI